MLYSLSVQNATTLADYVQSGGTLLSTYLTAWTDENSLVHADGYLAPLKKVFGVWSEELDALPSNQRMSVRTGFHDESGSFEASDFCELIHTISAHTIAWYDDGFYAGRASATVNDFGGGRAYYVASRNEKRFNRELMSTILDELHIDHLTGKIPDGVNRQIRCSGSIEYHFYLNASPTQNEVESDEWGRFCLQPWQVRIFERSLETDIKRSMNLQQTGVI